MQRPCSVRQNLREGNPTVICETDHLVGEDNPLRHVYECALAYEKGDWDMLTQRASQLRLHEAEIPQLFLEAVNWGRQSVQSGALTGESSTPRRP